MKGKWAMITGATSGIGEACAKEFAKNGINLVLTGRRQKRLDTLQKELSKKVQVYILCFDVSNKEDVIKNIQSLNNLCEIDILINNAGNAYGLAPIQNGSMNDFEKMININVLGLLYVSNEIIPSMIKKNNGHIINIGSIAGKEVYPQGNVYCASKFAVDAIGKGMRIDLNKHNIKVSNINPGLVETEFSLVRFKGNESIANKTYKGYDPLKANDIAELIYFVVSRPKHVNIADTLILPQAQASATVLNKK